MGAIVLIVAVAVGLLITRRIVFRRWQDGAMTTGQAAALTSVVLPVGLVAFAAYERTVGVVAIAAAIILFVAQFVTASYLLRA